MITVTDARKGLGLCHSEPSGAGAGGSTGRRAENLGLPIFAKLLVASSTSQQRNKEHA
jgi:hypothetical protein